jgi:hypothetical protein
MAINTETFFGRSTSTSISPTTTGATVSGTTRPDAGVQPSSNSGNEEKKTILSELIQIDKDVKKIQKLIAKGRVLRKKEEENNKKQNENKKREEKELRLEEKKERNLPNIKPTPFPKMGFLDRIRQFLFYTLLGSAFVKFGKHIPEILKFTKLLVPAFEFFENLTGNILNGIVDFIGAGYKAQDKIKEIAKSIGGEDLGKKFDEFNKQFNTFANLAIIAGLAATGGGVDFDGGKRERLGVDKQTGRRVSKRSQARFLERYGEKAYVEKFGKRSFKGLTRKTAGRLTGRFAGKALGKIPIIGGLVDFIISTVIFKEKPGRAAAKALGATIGSTLGTFTGIPLAGTILGGIVGDLVGGALYDSLVGDDKLKAKAKGGQATRGGKKVGGAVKRTIRKVKSKPPRTTPQKSIPGKDIGGKKQIEKLFPTSTDPRQKNPLGVLESTSKEYKTIPLIGGVMGSTIDSQMGQRFDNRVFKQFGIGLGYLIQSAIDSETTANIQRQIVGLAGGGMIPRTMSTEENVGMKIGERIAKTLQTMVNSKVSNTLQAIRQQLNRQNIYGGGVPGMGGGGGAGGGSVSVSSDSPDFWLLAVGALLENSHPQGAADVAQVIYNRVSSSSWPSTIRQVILQGNGGQFQPVRDYGTISAWQAIKDKDSAVNFIKKYGKGRTQAQLESVAAALLDTTMQGSSRTFVGPRDSFRAIAYEAANNHLADDTEIKRHGHVFGFEPRGAQIAAFRAGKLSAAQISQETRGTVTQLAPQSVSGNLKDTGIKDSSGRPIKLKGVIADAFIDMAAAARKDGINLGSGISVALRDPEHNRRVGGAQGSRHLTGEAFDINWNSSAGEWIKNNAHIFGFKHNEYSPQSTHFDWIGGYAPKSTQAKTKPKPDTRPPSPTPATVRTNLTRQRWDPSKSGLKQNPNTGVWEKASIAPQPKQDIASAVAQNATYEIASRSLAVQPIIVEKSIPTQVASNAPTVIHNNNTLPITASLYST